MSNDEVNVTNLVSNQSSVSFYPKIWQKKYKIQRKHFVDENSICLVDKRDIRTNTIGGSKRAPGTCAPLLGVQILLIPCSLGGKWLNNSFSHPPFKLALPPRGNIRHWIRRFQLTYSVNYGKFSTFLSNLMCLFGQFFTMVEYSCFRNNKLSEYAQWRFRSLVFGKILLCCKGNWVYFQSVSCFFNKIIVWWLFKFLSKCVGWFSWLNVGSEFP